jgi:hypothetical protein
LFVQFRAGRLEGSPCATPSLPGASPPLTTFIELPISRDGGWAFNVARKRAINRIYPEAFGPIVKRNAWYPIRESLHY